MRVPTIQVSRYELDPETLAKLTFDQRVDLQELPQLIALAEDFPKDRPPYGLEHVIDRICRRLSHPDAP